MSALPDIEARYRDCLTYNFGMRNADKLAHEDVPYILAELRKAREALERVEALAAKIDKAFNTDHSVDVQMRATAYQLRAAVAAAKGDERG